MCDSSNHRNVVWLNRWLDLLVAIVVEDYWLVVWNIFYFPIYWEESSQLTFIFFRGLKPPTRLAWGEEVIIENVYIQYLLTRHCSQVGILLGDVHTWRIPSRSQPNLGRMSALLTFGYTYVCIYYVNTYMITNSTAQGDGGSFKDRKPIGGWLL